jgi:hypothetical protein
MPSAILLLSCSALLLLPSTLPEHAAPHGRREALLALHSSLALFQVARLHAADHATSFVGCAEVGS